MANTKWLWLGVWILGSACWAQGKNVCTIKQAQAAEQSIALITSWDQFHLAYKAFKHCDDGAIGEGFSEAATLLLADKWHSLNRLNLFVRRDKKFLDFILKHIDETVPEERLQKIENNTKNKCVATTKSICLATYKTIKKLAASK